MALLGKVVESSESFVVCHWGWTLRVYSFLYFWFALSASYFWLKASLDVQLMTMLAPPFPYFPDSMGCPSETLNQTLSSFGLDVLEE